MKIYSRLKRSYKYKKVYFYLITFHLLISNQVKADDIEGVFIPQGKFDSALPTVTMMLDKNRAPVVRIAPSRPTVVIFPRQVSNCFSDHAALKTEKASSVKMNGDQKETNFYSVVFKVIGASIKDFENLDQTTVVCQLIDSNYYTIAVTFTDKNAYSVVKLIENPSEEINYTYDMSSFSSVRLGQKKPFHQENTDRKLKKEFIKKINDKNLIESETKPIEKKNKKSFDDLMKEKFQPLKKEDAVIVQNEQKTVKKLSIDFQNEVNSQNKNEIIPVKKENKNSKSEISVAELLDKKGYATIKGGFNESK